MMEMLEIYYKVALGAGFEVLIFPSSFQHFQHFIQNDCFVCSYQVLRSAL